MTTRQRQPAALRLNRTIEIEALTVERDRFGGVREVWTALPSGPVWANARQGRPPKEVYIQDASRAVALRYTTFRVRHRADFNETARVRFEGDLFDIKGIAEVGRRQWLDIITASAP